MKFFHAIRWRRWVLTAASVFITALLGLGAALFIILRHPEPLANWALTRQTSPYHISVQRVAQIARDRVVLEGVEITSRNDQSLAATIAKMELHFDPREFAQPGLHGLKNLNISDARVDYKPLGGPQISFHLDITSGDGLHTIQARDIAIKQGRELDARIPSMTVLAEVEALLQRRLQSVSMQSPVVSLDLDAWTGDTSQDKSPAPWDPGEITIRDAQVAITGADMPSVSLSLNVAPAGELHKIDIHTISLGEAGSLADIESVRLLASSDALQTRRLESLDVRGAHFHIDPSLKLPTFGTPSSEPKPEWFLGSLSVQDSSVSIRDDSGQMPALQASIDVTTGPLFMSSTEPVELQLSAIRLATPLAEDKVFLGVDNVSIVASPAGLAAGRIDRVLVDGASFSYDRIFRSWMQPTPSTTNSDTPPVRSDSPQWSVGEFELRNSRVRIEDLGFGIPGIDFAVATKLSELSTSALAGGSEKIETVELSDLIIHSPLDPFAPVINLRSIFIRFSPAGILRNELEEIVVLHPIIFVGEDLFWYADEVRKRTASEDETAEKPLWSLKRFEASYGRIVIATAGSSRLALPLNFSTKAENINFRDINELQLKLNLVVPKEDYVFPSYELELNDLYGNIEFGLPPKSGANNINNTLYSALTRFRQFLLSDLWLSITYDLQGVNGNFGGAGYGGYLDGGFSFFLSDAVPWIGWFSATGIDLKALTDVIAPESFQMEGPANLKVEINATGPRLDRMVGSFTTTAPGKMNITRLSPVIEALPEEWTSLKRDISRIGLEVLRDFHYEQGGADFWFLGDQGQLNLDLQGPQGSRKFSVFLHGKKPNPQWQNSSFQSSSR